MRAKFNHWLAVAAMSVAGWSLIAGGGSVMAQVAAPAPAQQRLAAVEKLKNEGVAALRGGDFNRGRTLLVKAAEMGDDPTLARLADWSSQFDELHRTFTAERRKEYQSAVDDVKRLLENHLDDDAVDVASRAFLLADDPDEFHAEPWVKAMVAGAIQRAEADLKQQHWLKALRLYSDLSALQPSTALWKDQLKIATRHIRLLAMYAPEQLQILRDTDAKTQQRVNELLHPSTRPASRPATQPREDEFKTDWHETLKGIQPEMLWDALVDAQRNYWRPVSYQDLLLGGIDGLRAVATTDGLQTTFTGLADAHRKSAFLAALDRAADQVRQAKGSSDASVARGVLAQIKAANAATVQLPNEVWVSEFADGATERLDPFSNMIWPNDIQEFNKTTQGEFSGVGIQIQLAKDGGLQVVSPLEDTPAFKAGIQAGDVITRIDGKSARGISLNQAVQTITGPTGTTVILTIRHPDGTVQDYSIQRQTIKVASVKGWRHRPGGGWDYYVDPRQKIGYLRVTSFTRTTVEDLDKAVDQMERDGAKGLILDLRYNPGGLLSAATGVVDKFLKKGVIVSTRPNRADSPNLRTQISARDDGNEFTRPMVVLVNQYSASASEIVSGALKDDQRALIVGRRTFGKGSVQMLFPLDGRSAYLKLTTAHYYLPNGASIHRDENSKTWGVDPDVSIRLTPDQMSKAIQARRALDVLHEAAGDDKAATTQPARTARHALEADPQLAAALLLLRVRLAGV